MCPASPRVSIVVPVYNGARFITEALESVLIQTVGDFELICVDDGSTDASPEILASIVDPRLVVYRQDNTGIAGARNAGIRLARGEFVAFLDQDDSWHEEKLERQLPVFAETEAIGLVHCQCRRIGERSEPLSAGPVVHDEWMRGDVRHRMLLGNLVPGTAGVVVRKECFDVLGTFDETLDGADDWEMWARIAGRYEFGWVPEALAFTRLHAANTSTNVAKMRAESLRVQHVLLDNDSVTRGLSPRELTRIERWGTARIHAYCASWLLRTGRLREARADLWRAFLGHPTKPRHLVLLLFALSGWLPRLVERRLV